MKKEIWENTGCEAETKRCRKKKKKKKHLQAWRLIINRECHKVGALGLYGLTKYDSILQQACLCACVCTRCSAALPGRKSDLTPPRDPPCMGGIKEQPNWSLCTVFLLVSYSSTQMSTHTFSAHIHATAHTISVLHVGLKFTSPQLSGVKTNVNVCVILNPAPPAFLFKSLKRKENTQHPHSQGLDVGRCNWHRLIVSHHESILSSQMPSPDTLVVKGGNRWNALLSVNNRKQRAFRVAGWNDHLHVQSAGAAKWLACNDKHHHPAVWKNRLQGWKHNTT